MIFLSYKRIRTILLFHYCWKTLKVKVRKSYVYISAFKIVTFVCQMQFIFIFFNHKFMYTANIICVVKENIKFVYLLFPSNSPHKTFLHKSDSNLRLLSCNSCRLYFFLTGIVPKKGIFFSLLANNNCCVTSYQADALSWLNGEVRFSEIKK